MELVETSRTRGYMLSFDEVDDDVITDKDGPRKTKHFFNEKPKNKLQVVCTEFILLD